MVKPGDTIGIAAVSSPFDRDLFEAGVGCLKAMGFEVRYRDDLFSHERYLAGSDQRRAEELTELITNPDVKAIIFARGGYGSQRVIPLLDPPWLARHPKPVIGYSDLTPLLAFLQQRCGFPVYYGPVVTHLGKFPHPETLDSFKQTLLEPTTLHRFSIAPTRILKEGVAEGPLAGGCLTLLCTSIGTPYEVDTEEAILFLEDNAEKTYAIDRFLTQLKQSGHLGQARGIVFGTLSTPPDDPHDLIVALHDLLATFPGPVILHFQAGHGNPFYTLPLGAKAKINTREGFFAINVP